MASERLQKLLAQAGIASRRAAEKYITEGRVRVNGEVVHELGAKADPATDTIEVDGYGVIEAEPTVYIAMHKPIHVVTTVSDPEKRQTVIDVLQMSRAEGRKSFEGNMPRVFPVGRLDFDAEGLLVLTNDGGLANDLLHPRYHVPKTYVVKVRGRPEERQLQRLQRGVRLREEDGSTSRPTAKADVRMVRESPSNTWLEMIIVEGRHHQVKRMCEAVGHTVIRLIRTEFGGIQLGELEPGSWRFLSEAEVELLRAWRRGDAADILALREGPSMTEKMFGEARPTTKRSGAPRPRTNRNERARGERSRTERESKPRGDDRFSGRGRGDGAPGAGARSGFGRSRPSRAEGDGGAPRERREGGFSRGRPEQGERATRAPGRGRPERAEGFARGRSPRGESRDTGAPREHREGGLGRGRPARNEGFASSRPPRGEGRTGAPRERREGGLGRGRPARNEGFASNRPPRGESRTGAPRERREGGLGRGRPERNEGFARGRPTRGEGRTGAPREHREGGFGRGRPERNEGFARGRPTRGEGRTGAPREHREGGFGRGRPPGGDGDRRSSGASRERRPGGFGRRADADGFAPRGRGFGPPRDRQGPPRDRQGPPGDGERRGPPRRFAAGPRPMRDEGSFGARAPRGRGAPMGRRGPPAGRPRSGPRR